MKRNQSKKPLFRRPAASACLRVVAFWWPEDRSKMGRMGRLLVLALLIASSNLFLINNVVSIKASTGGNLLGIRDVLMVVLIVLGLCGVPAAGLARNPYITVCKAILLMTCVAAAVGIANGGRLIAVGQEFLTMSAWALPLVVAPVLCYPRHLLRLTLIVKLLGCGIAIGVFGEALTGMQVRFVTSSGVAEGTVRSTPSCWPLIMLSATVAMVELCDCAPLHRKGTILNLCVWTIDVAGSLLTQSRTLLIGLATGGAVFVITMLLFGRRRFRVGVAVVAIGLLPAMWILILETGERLIRADFVEYYTKRYSVLQSVDSAVDYSVVDTRRLETQQAFITAAHSPIVGVGLGAPYRAQIIAPGAVNDDPAIMCHNIYAHFVAKYGFPGLAVFLAFHALVGCSLLRAARDRTELGAIGTSMSVGLINVLVCGSFGNVFGATYMVHVTMVWLGGLVAYETILSASNRRSVRAGSGLIQSI